MTPSCLPSRNSLNRDDTWDSWRLKLMVKRMFFKSLFKTMLRATGLCEWGVSIRDWWIISPRASNAESVSVSWRHMHDDVIIWKHFLRYLPIVRGIHRSPVNSPHKGQWRGALMFSLTCTRINGRANNGEAGDLRRKPRQLWRHCNDRLMRALAGTDPDGVSVW